MKEAEKSRLLSVPVGPLCLLLGHIGARARAGGDEARASVRDEEVNNYGHSQAHPRLDHHKNKNNNNNNNNNNHHHYLNDMDERNDGQVVVGHGEGEGVVRGDHLAGKSASIPQLSRHTLT